MQLGTRSDMSSFLVAEYKSNVPRIGPERHDAESVEQRHFLLQCNPTNVFSISTKGNHRFRARAVLSVDQNDISACRMDNIYTVVEGMAELIWINRLYGVHGSDPPDHERGRGLCRRERRF